MCSFYKYGQVSSDEGLNNYLKTFDEQKEMVYDSTTNPEYISNLTPDQNVLCPDNVHKINK